MKENKDCMQSFSNKIVQSVLAGSNGTCRSWGTAGQYFWTATIVPNAQNSFYIIEGFKNVDIYGVSVVGGIIGNATSPNKCAVVTDWSFQIGLDGTNPLISGSKLLSPDGYNIITGGPNLDYVNLSKTNNIINFASPIASVKQIILDTVFCQGIGAEFLNDVALTYNLYFTFYYKYEGE
jgi:hypothetical protein